MVKTCSYVVVPASWHIDPHPAEYCPNEPEPDSEYCWEHIERATSW